MPKDSKFSVTLFLLLQASVVQAGDGVLPHAGEATPAEGAVPAAGAEGEAAAAAAAATAYSFLLRRDHQRRREQDWGEEEEAAAAAAAAAAAPGGGADTGPS